MKLDFSTMAVTEIEHFKGGEGTIRAAMYADDNNRIMHGFLPTGASIGMHCHDTGSEIVFILAGHPLTICDGQEERLAPGQCHYCPKGSTHTMLNDRDEEVEIYAVVPQHHG